MEILKYTIPALIVMLSTVVTVYFMGRMWKNYLAGQQKIKNSEVTLPLRLQAYERMILLLERISPESLLIRVNKPGLTSLQLQSELLSAIRSEFEHNLSQQAYVSNRAWEVVRSTRNQITMLINKAAITSGSEISSTELSKRIIESLSNYPKNPVQDALEVIKNELRTLY